MPATAARPGPSVTLYTDAGVRSDRKGLGFLACGPGRIALGCEPRQGKGNPMAMEIEAARVGIARAMEAFPGLSAIVLRSDNPTLGGIAPAPPHISEAIASLRGPCAAAGVTLARTWCRGHSSGGTASGFLNSIVHGLASLGVAGEAHAFEIPLDPFWRLRLMDLHPNLVRDAFGPTRREAAHLLGVGEDVVLRLLASGHLREVRGDTVDPRRLLAAWRKAGECGLDRAAPLTPAPGAIPRRGHVDDPESGVRLAAAPRRAVEIAVEATAHGPEGAVGWVVEAPGGTAAGSARLPLVSGMAWPAALSTALAEAAALEPGFDEVVLSIDDQVAISYLNRGADPPDGLVPFLEDLDAALDARGAEFRAERPLRGVARVDPADRVVLALHAEALAHRPSGTRRARGLIDLERGLGDADPAAMGMRA